MGLNLQRQCIAPYLLFGSLNHCFNCMKRILSSCSHNTPNACRSFLQDDDIVYALRNQGLTCIATWGGSTSQGLGCSPMKAVRELGSERRRVLRPCKVIYMIKSTHNGEAQRIGHLWGIPWEVSCYLQFIKINKR